VVKGKVVSGNVGYGIFRNQRGRYAGGEDSDSVRGDHTLGDTRHKKFHGVDYSVRIRQSPGGEEGLLKGRPYDVSVGFTSGNEYLGI